MRALHGDVATPRVAAAPPLRGPMRALDDHRAQPQQPPQPHASARRRWPAGLTQCVWQADRARFPHGIKWLADQIHSRGLKIGLYGKERRQCDGTHSHMPRPPLGASTSTP